MGDGASYAEIRKRANAIAIFTRIASHPNIALHGVHVYRTVAYL